VLQEFRRLGYSPEVQEAFVCGEYGSCADVKNVLAHLPGREPGPAVLLAAHYDSVPAGPGASDDGAGVAAVLEIARALIAERIRRHPVVFLIDDGEEAGLLGARAFVAEPAAAGAREVKAVVNIDNRGSSGLSLMFETSGANAWLMRLYAASVERPATSSVFYTVYKQFPNDTDLTVFKKAGLEGFNLAYIGDVAHYHTPLDNVQNTNRGSLQHDGQNALALVRALANADLPNPDKREAVFFDLFGFRTVWWPAKWTYVFAFVSLFALVLVMVQLKRRVDSGATASSPQAALGARSLLWGLLGWLAMMAAPVLVALAISRALAAAGAFPAPFIAEPLPALAAFWLTAFAVSGLVAILFSRRAGFWGLWAGTWIWWTLLAWAAAFLDPGLSYPFLLPVMVAGLSAVPAVLRQSPPQPDSRGEQIAAIIPAATAACLWLPLAWLLFDALGVRGLPLITALIAAVVTTLAPLISSVPVAAGRWRWALAGVAGAAAVASATVALFMPPYSESAPQRLNIILHQDGDSGRARWLLYGDPRSIPESLRHSAAFGEKTMKPFPWSSREALAADAGHVEPAPILGEKVRRRLNGWQVYSCQTLPAEGIELRFVLAKADSIDAFLLDRSRGLPPEGEVLSNARPTTATPSQDGDVTILTRKVRLGAGETHIK
jgi:hypothetical protein